MTKQWQQFKLKKYAKPLEWRNYALNRDCVDQDRVFLEPVYTWKDYAMNNYDNMSASLIRCVFNH